MLDPVDYTILNLIKAVTPVRKIAKQLKMRSQSSVQYRIDKMHRLGLVTGPREQRSRSLTPQGQEKLDEWTTKPG